MMKLKIINSLIEYSFLLFILAVFIFDKESATAGFRFFYFLLILSSVLLLKWFHKINDKKKIGIPDHLFTLILIGGYLSLLGEFFLRLYYTIPFYDKIIHLFYPAIGMMAFFYLLKDHKFGITISFFAANGIEALWELLEWGVDNLLLHSPYMQGVLHTGVIIINPLTDTMLDILFGIVGTFILANILFIKKKCDGLWGS